MIRHPWTKTSKPPLGRPIERGHPLSIGMIGCWLFSEGAGWIVNDCLNYGKGLFASSVGPIWSGAPQGWALTFHNSLGEHLRVADNPAYRIKPERGVTLQAVFRADADLSGIVTKTNSNQPAPFDTYWASGNLTVLFGNNAGGNTSLSSSGWTVSTWYDMVVTNTGYSGFTGAITIYRNGVYQTSASNAYCVDGAYGLDFGNRNDGATAMTGAISLVRIWNRALSAVEVADLCS